MRGKQRIDPALALALRHWHGMTEAEWRRYDGKRQRGEKLNPIEAAEAAVIVERVRAWEREHAP